MMFLCSLIFSSTISNLLLIPSNVSVFISRSQILVFLCLSWLTLAEIWLFTVFCHMPDEVRCSSFWLLGTGAISSAVCGLSVISLNPLKWFFPRSDLSHTHNWSLLCCMLEGNSLQISEILSLNSFLLFLATLVSPDSHLHLLNLGTRLGCASVAPSCTTPSQRSELGSYLFFPIPQGWLCFVT